MTDETIVKWVIGSACAIVLGWALKKLSWLLKKTTFKKDEKELVIRIRF